MDSSDYSLLSTINSNTDAGLRELIDARTLRGSIVCPISPIHLAENAPKGSAHLAASLGRARLMDKWSARTELVFPQDVFSSEYSNFLNEERNCKVDIVSPNNKWFGIDLYFDTSDFKRRSFERIMDSISTSSYPRRKKRELRSKIRSSDADTMLELYHALLSTSTWLDSPFDKLSPEIVVGYITGHTSKLEFVNSYREIMRDVAVIYELASSDDKIINDLFSMIRSYGNKFHELVEKAILKSEAAYKEIRQISERLQMPTPEPRIFFKNTNVERNMLGLIHEQTNELSKSDVNVMLNQCPSIRICYKALWKYMLRAVQSVRSENRKQIGAAIGKPSFFSDVLHLCYTPYVSMLRCDRATNGLVENSEPLRDRLYSDRKIFYQKLEYIK